MTTTCLARNLPYRGFRIETEKRAMYARLLLEDYWGPNPIYAAEQFRTRFRISLELFDIIEREVTLRNDFFVQKSDCTGLSGFTPKQKVACSIRMLTSGVSAEEIDDKFRMGKSIALRRTRGRKFRVDGPSNSRCRLWLIQRELWHSLEHIPACFMLEF